MSLGLVGRLSLREMLPQIPVVPHSAGSDDDRQPNQKRHDAAFARVAQGRMRYRRLRRWGIPIVRQRLGSPRLENVRGAGYDGSRSGRPICRSWNRGIGHQGSSNAPS